MLPYCYSKLDSMVDQVLVNVSSSSTVLELKRLLAAEIPGNLRIEVICEQICVSLGFLNCCQFTMTLGFEADPLGPPLA